MKNKEYDQIKVGDVILLHKECEYKVASPLNTHNISNKVVEVLEINGGITNNRINKIRIIDPTKKTFVGLICPKCVKCKL